MIKMLFFRFLQWLESKGRRHALVTFEGDIIAFKYCLLYNELAGRESGWPNIYIHQFMRVGGIDGDELIHSHPHSTLSIILIGGYTEFVKKLGKTADRTPGSVIRMRYDEDHSIVKVIPDTFTLFMHWFEKKRWAIGLRPCENVCPRCADAFGQCEKGINTVDIKDILEYPDMAVKWRGTRWVPVTPDFESKIRIRQEAVAKTGVTGKKITDFTDFSELKR